jgi:hypothetical protein
MSMNYSPELVRALMQDRILEAQSTRLAQSLGRDDRLVERETLRSRLARLVSRRSGDRVSSPCQQPC